MDASTATLAYAFASLCVSVPLAAATMAASTLADTELKKSLEQSIAAYSDAFGRQDVAGIVAQYAAGAVFVNATGPKTDIRAHHEAVFTRGLNRMRNTVDQVWTVGTGLALAIGTYRTTGKGPSGAALEVSGFWTATFVQDGGRWKIRMLSVIPQAPPAT